MKTSPEWLIEKIGFYQKISFLMDFPVSSEDIALQIIATSQDNYFGSILDLEDHEMIDQIILSYDVNRVCFIENFMTLRSDVLYQDNYYLKVFKRLEAISNSKFKLKDINIKECGYCKGRDKRLLIEFKLNGKKYDLNFCIDSGELVLSFFNELNIILQETGFCFQAIRYPNGNMFVFFLSDHASEKINVKPKWNFDSFPMYWVDRARFAINSGNNKEALNFFKNAPKEAYQADNCFGIC